MPESNTAHVMPRPVASNERCAAWHLVVTIERLISAEISKFGQIR
jgi:hypothetical protein